MQTLDKPSVMPVPVSGQVNHSDEYDDIVSLLMDHRSDSSTETWQLVIQIADACMRNNHLWEDMGLPNRATLNELMQHRFTSLAAKNTENMKWKRFFYKQLCERADILICKSPSCSSCTDYRHCFESEEASGKQQTDQLVCIIPITPIARTL